MRMADSWSRLTNPSRTVGETAMIWECKNQATMMSLIPHSDIAEVGGMRAAGCTLQHQDTLWRTALHIDPIYHSAGTAKKNCNDSGQYGLR